MKVLVTAGGTEEPIDGVRRLTNTSTGATGGALARRFAERGAEVTLLHAARAALEAVPVERETYVTFGDLEAALRRLLGDRDWDAIVHLAAVADYRIASVEVDGRTVPHGDRGKIGSGSEISIRLSPNPKLVDSLKRWSRNPDIVVVAFKLTDDPDPTSRTSQVRSLLDRGTTDLVVHNDRREIGEEIHRAEIWSADGAVVRTDTKEELADAIFELLSDDPDRTGAGAVSASPCRS